jgi:hypothetical protein
VLIDPLIAAVAANTIEANLIAVGTVQALGPPPGMWSGLVAAYQEVTYRPVTYLKVVPPWLPRWDRLEVLHPVVALSRTADPEHPRLRADLFHPGAELVLFLRDENGRWAAMEENYGAVPLTPEVEGLLAKTLGPLRR